MPHYPRSHGSKRQLSGAKLGRPPTVGPPYKNIEPQDKERFEKILKSHYLMKKDESLEQSFDVLLKTYYSESKIAKPDGTFDHTLKPDDQRPSMTQFRYWANKIFKKWGFDPARTRHGESKYDKDLAGRSGTLEPAFGPGHQYQVDATPCDTELISQFSSNRESRVGRATLYIVVDVFSTMWVGIYLSLKPASWAGARMALFNAFRDKTSFASDLGLEIDKSEFPAEGACSMVLADNAEMTSGIAEGIVTDLLLNLKFARGYRGDDKGDVEKAFDIERERVSKRLPGFVRKTKGERGESQPRDSALLTLPDLYRIIFRYAIHHNNFEEVDPSKLTKEMIKDGVKPRRRDIWLWGIKHRAGRIRTVPEEQLYLSLLEKGTVSIHREGILFKGCWYRSEWTFANGYQTQKANRNKVVHMECRYLRHSADYILLCTSEGMKVAAMMAKSMRFSNCSFDEIELQIETEQREKGQRDKELREQRANINSFMDLTVTTATRQQERVPKAQIRKQNISENRQIDLASENKHEAGRFNQYVESGFNLAPTKFENTPLKEVHADKTASAHQDALSQLFNDENDDDSNGN